MSTLSVSSPEAYTKALLHCYKHSTQPVFGMLIGKRLGNGGGDACYITDVVPLFHSTQLSCPHPMVEVAYAHVQSEARTRGLSLLGVYVANERLNDKSIGPLTASVITYLRQQMPSGQKLLVWFIHNDTLTSPPSKLSITAFLSEKETTIETVEEPSSSVFSFGCWNSDTLSADSLSEESGISAVGEALEALAQYGLLDFEDHLENPQLNYLDQSLSNLKSSQLKK